MVELKRVLCPVDLSELSNRPLAYAAAIAAWYGGQLTALHVVPTFEPMEVHAGALFDPVRFVYPPSRDDVLDQLREVLTRAGVSPDDVVLAAGNGDTAATIVDRARAADVLVMGTHGRSGFDRLLLGSITEKVLAKATCPVLTIPPHAPARPAGVAFRTVLCPVDFSAASLQALGFAADLAQRAGAEVILLHAVEWLPEEEPRAHAHFAIPEYRQYLIEDAKERLAPLVSEVPPVDRGIYSLVAAGRAHREILRVAAERDADLIVMGARGRGGPPITQLGSTTHQVVRAAPCAVLTVRAPLGSE